MSGCERYGQILGILEGSSRGGRPISPASRLLPPAAEATTMKLRTNLKAGYMVYKLKEVYITSYQL
jgi:hypothetical protein